MLVKAARILTAIVSCFFIGLPILGFSGLKQFLLEHGVFEELCRAEINHQPALEPWHTRLAEIISDAIGLNGGDIQDKYQEDDTLSVQIASFGSRELLRDTADNDKDSDNAIIEGIGGGFGGGFGGGIGGKIGDIIATISGNLGGGIGGDIGRVHTQTLSSHSGYNATTGYVSSTLSSTVFNSSMVSTSLSMPHPTATTTKTRAPWTNTWHNTWWTPTSMAEETFSPPDAVNERQDHGPQQVLANVQTLSKNPDHPSFTDPKYGMVCMDRMIKFDSLISLGLVAAAFATLLAYLVLDYIGHVCGSIVGFLLVAGGVYILSVPEHEQIFDTIDRFYWGLLLMSFGSPFVVVSATDAASVVQGRPVVIVFILFAAIELGGGMWTAWIYLFKPKSTQELFNQYLALPCVLILINLAIAPFLSQTPAGNIERLLQRVFAGPICKTSDLLTNTSQFLWPQSEYPKFNIIMSQVKSSWFWLFAVYYTVSIVTFDLFYFSGVEYAWILDAADISYNFLYLRPALSALTAILVYFMASYTRLSLFKAFISVSILTCVVQVLQLTRQWNIVSILIGPARVSLVSLCFGFTLYIFGTSSFGTIYSIIIIISGVSDLFLPSLIGYIWINPSNLEYVMCVLCISSFVTVLIMSWKLYVESRKIQHGLLRREAMAANENTRQIPNIV